MMYNMQSFIKKGGKGGKPPIEINKPKNKTKEGKDMEELSLKRPPKNKRIRKKFEVQTTKKR